MKQETSHSEQNRQLIKRYYAVFAKGGDVPFEQFFAPDFIDHNGYPGQTEGPKGVREGYEIWRKSFHTSDFKLAELLVENDKVAVRTLVRGRQQGEYLWKSPPDRPVNVEAISIFRISGGKIRERWGLTDIRDYEDTI